MRAPETAVLARAAILLAALTVACLLLAGCASAGSSAATVTPEPGCASWPSPAGCLAPARTG